MPVIPFNLFDVHGKIKILHMSWIAFFISFVVWFNHAPLMVFIKDDLGLSDAEIEIVLLLNVALTIPARVIVGMIVDRFGAKLSFSVLLAISAIPCFLFALADNFEQLAWARFLLGFVGAGFVVGVRIIGDWFPASQVGTAEGVYAGWGNFGSAAAAMILPGIAVAFGWRWAIGLTGLISLLYALLYYASVENLPPELAQSKVRRSGGMEVTGIRDLFLYIVSILPLYASASLLVWKLSRPDMPLLTAEWMWTLHGSIWLLYFVHAYRIVDRNAERLSQPIASIHHYSYKQVFILAAAYLMTFGSKLAVVSMLPMFFFRTFNQSQGITLIDAGLLASSFVFMNLIARPAGGWLSDKMGRKLSLALFVAGLAGSYLLMAWITSDWPLAWAVAVTLVCSVFMQAAEGAIFAFVPLVKRSITGQVAGIVSAYGNAGAILFLVLLTFVPAAEFFLALSGGTFLLLAAIYYLDEPKNFITEILPDGSLLKIELD